MPQFEDVDEFLDEHLRLPIKGTVYAIPPLSGREGLRAQRLMDLALQVAVEEARPADRDKPAPRSRPVAGLELDDVEEEDFYALVLSRPVLEQMLEDNVTWPTIQRAAQTAFLWNTAGAEAAEARWREGAPAGKAPRPTLSGTAPSRTRAGRNGTKGSRKAQKRKAPTASPGAGSSTAGR